MGLLAFSFLFATIGTFVGFLVFSSAGWSVGTYWLVALAGLVVLFALNFLIQKPGINLFLLYLFTFLEGMSLSPLISAYMSAGTRGANILGEAFFFTAVPSFPLAIFPC